MPGINLMYSFIDILSAIVQVGGVNNNGSLRSVQLIRDGQVVNTVDFYSFFNKIGWPKILLILNLLMVM